MLVLAVERVRSASTLSPHLWRSNFQREASTGQFVVYREALGRGLAACTQAGGFEGQWGHVNPPEDAPSKTSGLAS
jgi:hypothetical protein